MNRKERFLQRIRAAFNIAIGNWQREFDEQEAGNLKIYAKGYLDGLKEGLNIASFAAKSE